MNEIDSMLALNALHEVETSPLTAESLTIMLENSFHWATANQGNNGYLISFDQDADYDSVNFLWFKSRYPRFVYVDRVVVAAQARGQGIAISFYDVLVAKAKAAGHDYIVCEINSEPPNPASAAFHRAFGFVEVGTAQIQTQKRVSYQALKL